MADADETAPSGKPDPAAPALDKPAGKAPAKPRTSAAKKKPSDPDELAAEIEKTREDLAETLDAIAEKVSPKRVAKRTTKKVTTAVKDTAHEAAESVKDGANVIKEKVSGGPTHLTELAETADVTEPIGLLQPPGPSLHVTPAWNPPAEPLVRPVYLAAGAAAALVAWLLVRSRR